VRDRGRFKYRVAYSKGEALRYMGHLDLVRAILRTIERARIPIVYSGGAKPRPKVSFTAPIPLGMTSQEEYFDMTTRIQLSDPATALARAAPQGMEIHRVDLIREPSVLSQIYRVARYRICGLSVSSTKADQFLRSSEIIYKERDIRPPVVGIAEADGEVFVDMVVERGRPWSVFEWLSGFPKEEIIKRKPSREWL
jgi:radical SAM-linked protein